MTHVTCVILNESYSTTRGFLFLPDLAVNDVSQEIGKYLESGFTEIKFLHIFSVHVTNSFRVPIVTKSVTSPVSLNTRRPRIKTGWIRTERFGPGPDQG